jgi:hypothetical protein
MHVIITGEKEIFVSRITPWCHTRIYVARDIGGMHSAVYACIYKMHIPSARLFIMIL